MATPMMRVLLSLQICANSCQYFESPVVTPGIEQQVAWIRITTGLDTAVEPVIRIDWGPAVLLLVKN